MPVRFGPCRPDTCRLMPADSRLLSPVFDNRPLSRRETACRSCGSQSLHPVIDLGEAPLADRLLSSEWDCRAEPRFPLAAVLCLECSLVQLTETVRPEVLFADDYPYYSSVSRTVLGHARANVEARLKERALGRSSLVVEIGSNDGYLLRNYVSAGVTVLGVDPAEGPAKAARAGRVDTIAEFFTVDLAAEILQRRGAADIVHAANVLTHAADPAGFARGVAALLKPDGVAVIEVPYLRDLVEGLQFDTIHHQHLCYFSLTALDRLLRSGGLFANRVERHAIHGGSLRVFVAKQDQREDSVTDMLAEEARIGIASPGYFASFAGDIAALREKLVGLIADLRASGHSVAAYGAAAKGAALLNACGLGRHHLDFVADLSPHKQGRLMPGIHLPIQPSEALFEERPDFTLLLAWNFAEEIIAQQGAYREAGGRFIMPLPDPRII